MIAYLAGCFVYDTHFPAFSIVGTFSINFRCTDLRDETDVRSRIKKATAQVGALRPFFRHPDIDLETKTQYILLRHSTPLGLRSMDHHRIHQMRPPSIPPPQSKNHTEHDVQSRRTKNHQCSDPETCQCTRYSHLPHEKIPSLDWQTSKNANEQTATPTPCRLGQKPTKTRKTSPPYVTP
jgi:hypothetical protein